MKHDNNLASMQDLLTSLKKKWTIQNLDIEIQISKGARNTETTVERKILEYSVNSSIRRKFFMHVLKGTYENHAISASEIKQELSCVDRTVETIIRECEKAEWIEVDKCQKGRRHIKATPILIETYENYTEWLWQALEKTGLRRLGSAVSELQKQIDEES